MKLLLDTHVILWLALAPDRMSPAAAKWTKDAEDSGAPLAISAVSLYEIAYLIRARRILLAVPEAAFLAGVKRRFEVLPVSGEVAVFAAQLPSALHGDPMDRIIAATAAAENYTLITADEKILKSGVCKTIW